MGPKRGRRLKIFFDGGCRPNPGRIEVALVARGATYFFDDLGLGTSSDAEWLALRMAVQLAHALGEPDFELIGDCANVIMQASGRSRCRTQTALDHCAEYRQTAAAGQPKRLRWTPRNQNLAGIALARRRSFPDRPMLKKSGKASIWPAECRPDRAVDCPAKLP